MRDRSLLLAILLQLEEAIDRVETRFWTITQPYDFTNSDRGLERLDAICMMLLTIRENIRRLEKVAGSNFLSNYQ